MAYRVIGAQVVRLCVQLSQVMSPSFREAGDITRFASRDHFAACNGTPRIEVSPGPRKIYGVSCRGNLRINHAVGAPRRLRPQRAV
jgi:hypothetical protein